MAIADHLVAGYDALRADIDPLLFLVRNKQLQIDGVARTEKFLLRVEHARIEAIQRQNEHEANSFLGLGMVVRALSSELSVYLLIKEDKPEEAWIKLIDAQEMIRAAGRAHPGFSNLSNKLTYLRELETALFPPQQFVSAGLIVHEQHCSICEVEYDKCDHIQGLAYMGRFCRVIFKKVTADHIAFVESPADRRCRVTSIAAPGGKRNRMTWVLESIREGDESNMTGIIAMTSPFSDEEAKSSE